MDPSDPGEVALPRLLSSSSIFSLPKSPRTKPKMWHHLQAGRGAGNICLCLSVAYCQMRGRKQGCDRPRTGGQTMSLSLGTGSMVSRLLEDEPCMGILMLYLDL